MLGQCLRDSASSFLRQWKRNPLQYMVRNAMVFLGYLSQSNGCAKDPVALHQIVEQQLSLPGCIYSEAACNVFAKSLSSSGSCNAWGDWNALDGHGRELAYKQTSYLDRILGLAWRSRIRLYCTCRRASLVFPSNHSLGYLVLRGCAHR